MKCALITGVLGQDGTLLARWLLSKGYEVHGVVRGGLAEEQRRIQERFPPVDSQRLRFHSAALEDADSLQRTVQAASADEVYHLAGVSDSRQSFSIPEETCESITLGSLRLMEACRKSTKPIRFFLASSCEVFGIPQQIPQTVLTPRWPITPYGIAKNAAEALARLYRDQYGQFIVTGILYNHESPLRRENYLSARVAKAVAAIKAGTQKELELGDLHAQRDWSDARDFVKGFYLALQANQPGDYIFASGQTRTVADLVEVAFAAGGLDFKKFVKAEVPQVGTPVAAGLCGDISNTMLALGWMPQWTFEQTIRDMVQAELEQKPIHLRSDPSPNRSEARLGALPVVISF